MTVVAPPRNSRTRRQAPPAHPVTQYAREVVAGRVIAGRLVKLACQRHLRDLKDGGKRGLRFDEASADRVLQFFSFLKQRKGEWANQTIQLEPWQVFRIGSVFGWKRWDEESQTWLRRFRTAYNEVARKNGKTTEAAGIGNYLAFFDGEPGAEVYAAATKRDQAKVCWSEAKWQIEHLPDVIRRGITCLTANMHNVGTASKFEPLGADMDSGDSINMHALILDELHAWKSREYLEKLFTASGSRRQPVIWIITTAGPQGDSLYAEQHEYAVKVLEGAIEDDSFFAFVACVDEPDRWADEGEWAKANPNLGISVKVRYLRDQCAKAREIPSEESSFKRYHCNVRVASETKFISGELWNEQAAQTPRDDLVGVSCFGGLDLANTTDVAALCLWFPDADGEGGDLLSWFWVPEEGIARRAAKDRVPYDVWADHGFITTTPGSVIDYGVIEATILGLAERYHIQTIGMDPWNGTQTAKRLDDAGVTVITVPQTMARLTAPTKELERLLMLRGLRHGGNPVLRWMASNAVARRDSSGNIRLDKDKSAEKIDGLAAAVLAIGESMSEQARDPQVW